MTLVIHPRKFNGCTLVAHVDPPGLSWLKGSFCAVWFWVMLWGQPRPSAKLVDALNLGWTSCPLAVHIVPTKVQEQQVEQRMFARTGHQIGFGDCLFVVNNSQTNSVSWNQMDENHNKNATRWTPFQKENQLKDCRAQQCLCEKVFGHQWQQHLSPWSSLSKSLNLKNPSAMSWKKGKPCGQCGQVLEQQKVKSPTHWACQFDKENLQKGRCVHWTTCWNLNVCQRFKILDFQTQCGKMVWGMHDCQRLCLVGGCKDGHADTAPCNMFLALDSGVASSRHHLSLLALQSSSTQSDVWFQSVRGSVCNCTISQFFWPCQKNKFEFLLCVQWWSEEGCCSTHRMKKSCQHECHRNKALSLSPQLQNTSKNLEIARDGFRTMSISLLLTDWKSFHLVSVWWVPCHVCQKNRQVKNTMEFLKCMFCSTSMSWLKWSLCWVTLRVWSELEWTQHQNNPDPTHNFLSTPTTKSTVPADTDHIPIGMQSRPPPALMSQSMTKEPAQHTKSPQILVDAMFA